MLLRRLQSNCNGNYYVVGHTGRRRGNPRPLPVFAIVIVAPRNNAIWRRALLRRWRRRQKDVGIGYFSLQMTVTDVALNAALKLYSGWVIARRLCGTETDTPNDSVPALTAWLETPIRHTPTQENSFLLLNMYLVFSAAYMTCVL